MHVRLSDVYEEGGPDPLLKDCMNAMVLTHSRPILVWSMLGAPHSLLAQSALPARRFCDSDLHLVTAGLPAPELTSARVALFLEGSGTPTRVFRGQVFLRVAKAGLGYVGSRILDIFLKTPNELQKY